MDRRGLRGPIPNAKSFALKSSTPSPCCPLFWKTRGECKLRSSPQSIFLGAPRPGLLVTGWLSPGDHHSPFPRFPPLPSFPPVDLATPVFPGLTPNWSHHCSLVLTPLHCFQKALGFPPTSLTFAALGFPQSPGLTFSPPCLWSPLCSPLLHPSHYSQKK